MNELRFLNETLFRVKECKNPQRFILTNDFGVRYDLRPTGTLFKGKLYSNNQPELCKISQDDFKKLYDVVKFSYKEKNKVVLNFSVNEEGYYEPKILNIPGHAITNEMTPKGSSPVFNMFTYGIDKDTPEYYVVKDGLIYRLVTPGEVWRNIERGITHCKYSFLFGWSELRDRRDGVKKTIQIKTEDLGYYKELTKVLDDCAKNHYLVKLGYNHYTDRYTVINSTIEKKLDSSKEYTVLVSQDDQEIYALQAEIFGEKVAEYEIYKDRILSRVNHTERGFKKQEFLDRLTEFREVLKEALEQNKKIRFYYEEKNKRYFYRYSEVTWVKN